MSDIIQYLKNLFKKKQSVSQPLVHEVLKRDDKTKQAYADWKTSGLFEQLMEVLKTNLLDVDEGISRDGVLLIDNPKTRGFLVRFDFYDFREEDFQHLFDYLRERTQEIGYRNYSSDIKNFVKEEKVQTIERHYLKPAFHFYEDLGKIEQQYGNITIEQHKTDQKPVQIKYISNVYSDRNYTEVKPFRDLLEQLVD